MINDRRTYDHLNIAFLVPISKSGKFGIIVLVNKNFSTTLPFIHNMIGLSIFEFTSSVGHFKT